MKTDLEIQKDVMDELKWEPLLNANEIGVAVKNGVVTLTGSVDTYFKKEEAENAANRVAGVKAVAEEIKVEVAGFGEVNDTDIAEMITNSLNWNSAVRGNKIKVTVENGWVTLDGEVDWGFQKEAAGNAVKSLIGIKGINNLVTVKPSVTAKNIKQKISGAFHRSATVDSRNVNIEIKGSRAILSGKVRSWAEKNDAENAAWKAPGINTVENKLQVDTEILAF